MIKIVLKLKSVYGTIRAYPVCMESKLLCSLLSQKTFTESQVKKLRMIGFDVSYEQTNFGE